MSEACSARLPQDLRFVNKSEASRGALATSV